MSMKISQNFPIYTNTQAESKKTSANFGIQKEDSFTSSISKPATYNPSFGFLSGLKKLFSSSYDTAIQTSVYSVHDSSTSDYAIELSKGLKTRFDKDIPPQNLVSIMTPEEFRKKLPELKAENFKGTYENLKNGIYCADLDYATNYSNGKNNIFDILERVSEISNQYKALNPDGDKFIFAITDRDSLEGIQHIIRIVGQNPQKFQNVKILPAVKLSYAHEAPESNIGFENSEMLVYGINPFSQDLINFVDKLSEKRKQMLLSFIKEVNRLYPEFSYNILEFAEQNSLKYAKDYTTVSNLYWRAREYAESKGDTVIRGKKVVPEKIRKEADKIIQEMDIIYRGSDEKSIPRYTSTLIDENSAVNRDIRNVFNSFSTYEDKDEGKITSSAESLYDEMVECLSKTNGTKPVMALCTPFYLSHHFEKSGATTYDNVVKFIDKLKTASNGMLLAFESVAPAYRKDQYLDAYAVERFNDYIRNKTNLYEVGGAFDNIWESAT